MIYQVKNHEKIPLGTQFDSSWEVEYNRDLSSQISGKSEWTATEDCWFQYATSVTRKDGETWNNEGDINTTRVLLNGIKVSTNSSSYTWNSQLPVRVFTFMASVLVKKGDVIQIIRDGVASPSSPLTFAESDIHVFPIHRILSKDEGPVDVTLTVDCAQSTQRNKPYTITLYPIGNDVYIFATPLMTLYPTATTMNIVYSLADFDILDYKADYWQVAEGLPNRIGALGSDGATYQSVVEIRSASDNTHALQIRGQGIVRRKQS